MLEWPGASRGACRFVSGISLSKASSTFYRHLLVAVFFATEESRFWPFGLILGKHVGYAESFECRREGESIVSGRFELYRDVRERYRFRLKSDRGETILTSEGFDRKTLALDVIVSIMKSASEAIIVDLTLRESQELQEDEATFFEYDEPFREVDEESERRKRRKKRKKGKKGKKDKRSDKSNKKGKEKNGKKQKKKRGKK